MNPVSTFSDPCGNPNYFSSVVAPAVEKRLPPQGSVVGIALDHLTSVRPFFQNVSRDLCDDALLSMESAHSATRFIARSATSAAIISTSAELLATGLTLGSPFAALLLGGFGLTLLPPLAERLVVSGTKFGKELLEGAKDLRLTIAGNEITGAIRYFNKLRQ